jgi:hypothetical protein
MKRLTILLAMAIFCKNTTAQDTTVVQQADTGTVITPKNDTMRIGNILIIKHGKKNKDITINTRRRSDTSVVMGRDYAGRKNARVTTNWWILDLGFANFDDQTNYANTGGYLVNAPGAPAFSKNDFKVKTGKSINVNIWFFMQRLNIIKNNVSLKYGLGLELNNYRYKSGISYRENGVIPYDPGRTVTNAPFIFRDSIAFSKNKLAADYLTVPLMLSFSSNRTNEKKGFGASFGVSAGYLYSQRNKQKSDANGKHKNKGDYDLNKFKISYIGELALGPVRLYGSYSPKSMYDHSLDMRPYTFGLRFSNL